MDSSRTPRSGQGLTLITGLGGRPVDRTEVETWCQTRRTDDPRLSARVGANPLVSA